MSSTVETHRQLEESSRKMLAKIRAHYTIHKDKHETEVRNVLHEIAILQEKITEMKADFKAKKGQILDCDPNLWKLFKFLADDDRSVLPYCLRELYTSNPFAIMDELAEKYPNSQIMKEILKFRSHYQIVPIKIGFGMSGRSEGYKGRDTILNEVYEYESVDDDFSTEELDALEVFNEFDETPECLKHFFGCDHYTLGDSGVVESNYDYKETCWTGYIQETIYVLRPISGE